MGEFVEKNYQRAYEKMLEQSQDWLKSLRAKNFSKFKEQGFPTKRDENWKYTDIAEIAKDTFNLTPAEPIISEDLLLAHSLENCHSLVFVNGYFVPQLSYVNELPKEVILTGFADALQKHSEIIKSYLEKNSSQQSFDLLNFSLMQDGAFLYVPKNIILDKPIQLSFFTTTQQDDSMQHLRNLIIIEENAAVTLVESYVGENNKKYFNNVVTQVFANNNSKVNYFKNQNESRGAYHIARIEIEQKANSHVCTYSFSFGARLARDDLQIALMEQGANCALQGLYCVKDGQHIDHHTRIDHFVPNCNSYEFYKGILDGKSKGVFNGKVIVHKHAQKTSAQQSNKNLLLSKTAEINTKPELEIYADDVQCTHGATVGQLDEQALFYLRSRGIDEVDAINILMYAFASEIVETIKNPALQEFINKYLAAL